MSCLLPDLVFYDDECSICRYCKRLAKHWTAGRFFIYVPLQQQELSNLVLGMDLDTALTQMHVVSAGKSLHGYDAVCFIISRGFQHGMCWEVLQWKPIRKWGQLVYAWIALHRHCSIRTLPHRSRPG